MKALSIIAVARAAAMAGILSASAAFALAASASASPVVYNYAEGFHHGRVQPRAIYVGSGGSPYVIHLRWSHWNRATASGHGRLWEQIPGCTKPTYQCPYYHHSARVYLYRVRSHHGTRYFSRMRWTSHSERIVWKSDHGYWDY